MVITWLRFPYCFMVFLAFHFYDQLGGFNTKFDIVTSDRQVGNKCFLSKINNGV